MMTKELILENDNLNDGKCPECEIKLVSNQEWDELFDRYDATTPSFDLIVNRLYREGVPKYICSGCGTHILIARY